MIDFIAILFLLLSILLFVLSLIFIINLNGDTSFKYILVIAVFLGIIGCILLIYCRTPEKLKID